MLTVACVKWGSAYGPEYVNRLQAMVERHLTLPHEFVCFTDDSQGVKCETRELPGYLHGWWNKIYLFKREVLTERVLYIDLDTVILRNIDDLGRYKGKFAMLSDFYYPENAASGLMMWEPGYGSHIWAKFKCDGYPSHEWGDQGFIRETQRVCDRIQDKFPGIVSFKVHCNEFEEPDARVVCFHGMPKPHHLNGWVRKHWREDEDTDEKAAA